MATSVQTSVVVQTSAVIPKNFNWRIIPYITKNKSINSEEKAKKYFRSHGHTGSEVYKNYFKVLYKIPNGFDEEKYIDYLQKYHNVKVKSDDEIAYEKLYHFYDLVGRKKYPLNDEYFCYVYNINDDFDKDIYKRILDIKNIDEYKKYTSIYEYYGKKGKTQAPLNLQYYKILHNLPDDFNDRIYIKCYKELQYETNLETIVKYYLQNKQTRGLNDAYYKVYFNIPDNYDKETIVLRYPECVHDLQKVSNLTTLAHFLKKYPLDSKYSELKTTSGHFRGMQSQQAQPTQAQQTQAQQTQTQQVQQAQQQQQVQRTTPQQQQQVQRTTPQQQQQVQRTTPQQQQQVQRTTPQQQQQVQRTTPQQQQQVQRTTPQQQQQVQRTTPQQQQQVQRTTPQQQQQQVQRTTPQQQQEQVQTNDTNSSIQLAINMQDKLMYYLYFQPETRKNAEKLTSNNLEKILQLFNTNKEKKYDFDTYREEEIFTLHCLCKHLQHKNILIDNTMKINILKGNLTVDTIYETLLKFNMVNSNTKVFIENYEYNITLSKYFSNYQQRLKFFYLKAYKQKINLEKINKYYISEEHDIFRDASYNYKEYQKTLKNI